MKKLTALALCLLLMLGMIPVTAEDKIETITFTLNGYKAGAKIEDAELVLPEGFSTPHKCVIYDVTSGRYEPATGVFRTDRAYGVCIALIRQPMMLAARDGLGEELDPIIRVPGGILDSEDVPTEINELYSQYVKLTNPHFPLRVTYLPIALLLCFDLEPLEGYPVQVELTLNGYEVGAKIEDATLSIKDRYDESVIGEYVIAEKKGDEYVLSEGVFKTDTTYYLAVWLTDKEQNNTQIMSKATGNVPPFLQSWFCREVTLTNGYVSEEFLYDPNGPAYLYELKPLQAPTAPPVPPATGDATNTALLAALLVLTGAAMLLLRRRAHN